MLKIKVNVVRYKNGNVKYHWVQCPMEYDVHIRRNVKDCGKCYYHQCFDRNWNLLCGYDEQQEHDRREVEKHQNNSQ